jgi:excisionase family DNA binding protein
MSRKTSKSKSSQGDRSLLLGKYPERMSVKEVASYLNCSDDLVRKLVQSGTLPALNLCARGSNQICYRIDRAAVAEFERRNKE